jgi:predicted nucleic acid-binding protein
MPEERSVYLDAGPVVALFWERDKLHQATLSSMTAIEGKKVTSYLSCLEALVVLRRIVTADQEEPPARRLVAHLWNSILREVEKAGVEVKATTAFHHMDLNRAETMMYLIARSPVLTRSDRGSRWVRGVGVMDCLQLSAARSLEAAYFLTTDRCLAKVDHGLGMILIGDYVGAQDVIWPVSKGAMAVLGESGI